MKLIRRFRNRVTCGSHALVQSFITTSYYSREYRNEYIRRLIGRKELNNIDNVVSVVATERKVINFTAVITSLLEIPSGTRSGARTRKDDAFPIFSGCGIGIGWVDKFGLDTVKQNSHYVKYSLGIGS